MAGKTQGTPALGAKPANPAAPTAAPPTAATQQSQPIIPKGSQRADALEDPTAMKRLIQQARLNPQAAYQTLKQDPGLMFTVGGDQHVVEGMDADLHHEVQDLARLDPNKASDVSKGVEVIRHEHSAGVLKAGMKRQMAKLSSQAQQESDSAVQEE